VGSTTPSVKPNVQPMVIPIITTLEVDAGVPTDSPAAPSAQRVPARREPAHTARAPSPRAPIPTRSPENGDVIIADPFAN
jgi:hypothetical protein